MSTPVFVSISRPTAYAPDKSIPNMNEQKSSSRRASQHQISDKSSLPAYPSLAQPMDVSLSSQMSTSAGSQQRTLSKSPLATTALLASDMLRTRASRSGSGFSKDDTGMKWTEEEKEGLIQVKTGDVLLNRYEVLGLAGQGTFGTVLDVYDRQRRMRLALKVVRAVPRYTDAAMVEVDILQRLQRFDVRNESLCVRLLKTFKLQWSNNTHMCLGFEKLGRSLFDFIRRNGFRGFRLCDVRHFAFQLLLGLAFCHRAGLIHTDLKPENILLCHSDCYESGLGEPPHVRALTHKDVNRNDGPYRVPVLSTVRLIDFGGGILPEHYHTSVVNTRQYRSPEVILGLGWSYPSDVWSAACIFAELFSGELLFSTHDDLEHLALMEKVLEKPCPVELTRRAITKSGPVKLPPLADVDVGSRPRNRRGGSHSDRYKEEEERHRNAQRQASGRDRDHRRAGRSGRTGRSRSRSTSRERAQRMYPQRDWHEERKRSQSTMRAADIVRADNYELRWPENAIDRSSVQYVRRAATLKAVLFSGFQQQFGYGRSEDEEQAAILASNAKRLELLASIASASEDAVGVDPALSASRASNSNLAADAKDPDECVRVERAIEESIVADTRDCMANHAPALSELVEFHDLLTQMLRYDAGKRITARMALFHPFFDPVREMYKPPRFLEDASPLIDHAEYRRKLDELKAAKRDRPEPLATQALRMTAEDIAGIPPTCANTLYRDETGRLQRGPPKFDMRPAKTYLVPQSDGHHAKCAMTYRGNTQKFQSSLKRRTTSSFNAASTRNSKTMSQTIPAPNGQASNVSAFAATASSMNADATATANFTVDPAVASAVQTQKRTLNPQRGLNNTTFNTTGRIALAENAPRKFIPAGYQGHVQGAQHIFGKSFSSISEAILTYRDDARTPTKPSYQEII